MNDNRRTRQVKEFVTKPRKTKVSAEEFWEIWVNYVNDRMSSLSEKNTFLSDGTMSTNKVQTPITLADFCSFAGFTQQTFWNYKNEKSNAEGAKELADVANVVNTRIEAFLTEEGLLGNYNTTLLIKMITLYPEQKEDDAKDIIILSRENVTFAKREDKHFSKPPKPE